MNTLPEYIDDLPNVCGSEPELEQVVAASRDRELALSRGGVEFSGIRAACAIALHQHQPLIPAGGENLRSAGLISDL